MDKISLRLGLNSGADLREGLGMRDLKGTLLTLFPLYIKILAFAFSPKMRRVKEFRISYID